MDRIAMTQRSRPPFRFSFITVGCMTYFMKSSIARTILLAPRDKSAHGNY